MRKVCRLAREVLDIAAAAAKPGVTTDYIDEIVHKACMERDVSVHWQQGTFSSMDKTTNELQVIPVTAELLPLPQVSMYLR